MPQPSSYKMMRPHEKVPSGISNPVRPWWRRKRYFLTAIIMLLAIGLAVGLGVGLTSAQRCGGSRRPCTSSITSYPSAPTTTETPAPPAGTGTVSNGVWRPENGTTWQIQLNAALRNPSTDGIDVWDIDLFENEASAISNIQSQGTKVICYFSGGSYEDWRPDASQFPQSDIGSGLDGWEGESWININSDAIRQIMVSRLDMAAEKGCNGVDPDNVDAYNNDNGLGLTTDDTINYMKFLADEAHARGLSIGLKNALEVVPDLVDHMQWSVNEQCLEYNECDTLHPFLDQQKPVFHVEYPKGDNDNNGNRVASDTRNDICNAASTNGFSTIIKNMNLDSFTESCPITAPARRG
jgi:hypothetical protein